MKGPNYFSRKYLIFAIGHERGVKFNDSLVLVLIQQHNPNCTKQPSQYPPLPTKGVQIA